MFGLWTVARDFIVLGLVVGGILVLSLTVSNSEPAPSVAQIPEPVASTTPVAVRTPPVDPVATTTETAPAPAPAPTPAPKPVPKKVDAPAPKVEDLGITLDDAIESINSLAQGQSPAGQSVNDRVRAALVNILCTSDVLGGDSISGSGIIIDPRGVVLTNAHVAQFFLLKDYPTKDAVKCVIRTGSPAYPRYTADLMFLPPSWVRDNARKIVQEVPTGTGERDYALVRITGGVSSSITLPAQFPFLLVSTVPPDIGNDVLQAGYAAGFLGGVTIQSDLYASSAWTKIRDVFTFNANTTDLVSLGGSIVAQGGSSGGPVTNTDGTLVGVIVTNSGTGDTSTRDLHALTSSYIVRDFEAERGKSLSQALSADLAQEVSIYNSVYAPSARAALIAEITK